jgi:GxxExxY protein
MTEIARRHEDSKVTKKRYGENTPQRVEEIASIIIDAGLKIHRELGPGLLESVYEECLFYELTKRGLKVRRQVQVPIKFDGIALRTPLRLDLLVEDLVIIDTKSVEEFHPRFKLTMRSYLRLSGLRLGLILNFNVVLFKDGIQRIVL